MPLAIGSNMKKILILFLLINLILPSSVFANATSSINLCIYRCGGNNLSVGDAAQLAKYDRIIANKSHYNDDPGGEATTWANIKAINASAKIYLYQSAVQSESTHDPSDGYSQEAINYLDRCDEDRGHSMGDLNTDNSNLNYEMFQFQKMYYNHHQYRKCLGKNYFSNLHRGLHEFLVQECKV